MILFNLVSLHIIGIFLILFAGNSKVNDDKPNNISIKMKHILNISFLIKKLL